MLELDLEARHVATRQPRDVAPGGPRGELDLPLQEAALAEGGAGGRAAPGPGGALRFLAADVAAGLGAADAAHAVEIPSSILQIPLHEATVAVAATRHIGMARVRTVQVDRQPCLAGQAWRQGLHTASLVFDVCSTGLAPQDAPGRALAAAELLDCCPCSAREAGCRCCGTAGALRTRGERGRQGGAIVLGGHSIPRIPAGRSDEQRDNGHDHCGPCRGPLPRGPSPGGALIGTGYTTACRQR
mmetsp:Transcript_64425/g.185122  ORF Transcript_64425/g.185122 Transcript_64425/m.185122 type:complete len:243 (+) Transcript_64425:1210-1938(+)